MLTIVRDFSYTSVFYAVWLHVLYLFAMKKDVKRLYASFQPEHYLLRLDPDREAQAFSGMVTISGQKAGRPTKRITFHQKDLKITAAEIVRYDKKGEQTIPVTRINHHQKFNEVRLHAEQMLYPGRYVIKLEFVGKITRPMNGVYPCFFKHDGQDKQLIATQFESHHAREVFPCIDEPEAKATFDLTLVTPADETVLSNTPVRLQQEIVAPRSLVAGQPEQETGDKRLETVFETTPKMSTYLLAFVYGGLGYKESKTKDGTVVRIYATPDNVEFTDFALETAVKVLEFYNEYFDIPYPLPKCDMVALPDFAAGAMENWGLITYREQALLVDPKNTSLSNKQWVAMVVAHELAHQWFGNLVTMRWWTDLWLNEGFASWIEYLAVDHLFPEWQMWTQFAVDEQQRAFKLDALEHTHPIEVPVHHPDEIRIIFDTISYNKGASAIHMLHQYLSPHVFRDGLRHYLKRHAYGNTDTIDLWQALEEISKKPVKDFMHAWTSQPGFPIVRAQVEDSTVQLLQERFYLNPEHQEKPEVTWPVPLLIGSGAPFDLLEGTSASFELTNPADFKLNLGRSGFYRVSYNPAHLEQLGKRIQAGELSPLDRLGVLSDVFEAAKAGQARTVDAFRFLEAFADESDNAVWDIIASGVTSTRAVMDDEDLREAMKPFIRTLTAKQLKRLGWEAKKSDSHFDRLLRPTVLGLAASADEPGVVKECLHRFDAMNEPEDIDPDLRGVVYSTVVRKRNNKETFGKLFAMHEATTLSEERTTIAAALTGFKNPTFTKRALSLIDSPSVRLQDAAYWIAYSFLNRFGRDEAWEWMTKNWKWLEKNLGNDMSFPRFPLYAANGFSNRAFLKKFNDFFNPRISPTLERSVNQGREVITWQSAWKERDFAETKKFFESLPNQ